MKASQTIVASAVFAACSAAFAQGRDGFMHQQAYAEMQRVSGQVEVLENNIGDLQRRVGRLEGGGDARGLRQELDAVKADIASLRREMKAQRDSIIRELSGQIAVILKKSTPPPPPAQPAPPPSKPAYTGPCQEYVVQPGDTLSLVAEAFGTTVSKIKEMNRLKGDGLRIGQKLLVPKK